MGDKKCSLKKRALYLDDRALSLDFQNLTGALGAIGQGQFNNLRELGELEET